MGLRDKLYKGNDIHHRKDRESKQFDTYGIIDNPFPSASQTQDHPHMETDADDKIVDYVRAYDQHKSTQVLVIEGDQGTGKTNLLNYYERQFEDIYPERDGFYIIRYYADPEPGFDKMLARILEELGPEFIKKVARTMAEHNDVDSIVDIARMSDMRTVLRSLYKSAKKDEVTLEKTAEASIEWILGFRLLKRHREMLGPVHFRLDTVESKTQAFRDLIFCSVKLKVLNGLILLLDELEKTDNTTSKLTVLRFLSAIRALIDTLPEYLFLMAAMTPEARRRYFEMLPAFAGRLQNRIELPYLKDKQTALKLYEFYMNKAQEKAISRQGQKPPRDTQPVITKEDAAESFDNCLKTAQERGDEGVRQRDFLNELHKKTEKIIAKP